MVDAPTLHLIGHGHIDPVWLWRWPEGFQEVKATFRSALDRMAENDEFIFTASSAAFYEWIHRNDPAMFGEIANRVAEGRWSIVGGWWVEADCNLAGGESYARQALIGQRWFREHLGVTATVGFNPDSFGHHAMLPQLLARSGLAHYVFLRPNDRELNLPGRTFWWESDDGSRVLAFRIPFEYMCWPEQLDEHITRCAAELKAPPNHMMCFYGVGNHGGGPTRENLEAIHRLRGESRDLPKLVMSEPGQFFAAVRASGVALPVVRGELQRHASGCYAAHSGIKGWNRRAERLLLDAERLSAVAARVTAHTCVEDLGRAWKNVLFNQFHDILAGTSIEPAYTDARDELGEAAAIAARASNDALQSMTWRVDVVDEPGSIPIVAWNPHSWESTVPVELEVGRVPSDAVVIDDEGSCTPVQHVTSLATVQGGRSRLAFLARLPSLGYRLYRVVAGDGASSFGDVEADNTVLDNGLLRVELDRAVGVHRVFDQRHGAEVLDSGALRAEVLDDRSDTWSHGLIEFGDVVGVFEIDGISLIERGAVRSAVRIESRFGSSQLIQDLILYRDLPYLDVRATLDWRERFKALKLRFPVNVRRPRVTYEIPFGTLRREADGSEVPGQRWVDLTGTRTDNGTPYGLSVMTDSKHSFDARGSQLSVTVVRSPIYAHHDPRLPTEGDLYSFQDQGIQRVAYRLVPHEADWSDGTTVRLATELNHPPTLLVESAHPGTLAGHDSFLRIDASNVVLTAFKEAEDGDALIVRCHESSGKPTTATIALPQWHRRIEASFRPSELKTFRVPDNPRDPVTEVNLLEWDLAAASDD